MNKFLCFSRPLPYKAKWANYLSNSSKVCFFVFFALASTKLTAQTFPSSCTSKDLELVSATLTGGDACNSCTPGTNVTRTLVLGINNKTGSTRPAFAFWATLVITDDQGNQTSTAISRCAGPIPPTGPLPNVYTGGDFGTITYACGSSLELVDLHLAWSDAGNSPKSQCPYILTHSSSINPKCGTLPSVQINAGLSGTLNATAATCAGNDGSIALTPFGGTSPYSFAWTTSDGAIPSGQEDDEDLSGLSAGTYQCVITDANNCTSTKSREVGAPAGISAPAATVTQPDCATATGAVQVTDPDGDVTYTLKQLGVLKYTANASGLFGAVNPGTYDLIATEGDCTAEGDDVVVNAQPATPGAPSVCVVQPSLCGPATGTVTVTSPLDAGNEYSINNGTTWQSSNVFNNVAAGAVTGIKVKTAAGCISDAADCDDSDCEPAGISSPSARLIFDNVTEETTVKAFPNPFSDRVKFLVTSSVAGRGNIEVYNMMGQKLKTVYEGFISAGTQTFELSLPTHQIASLVYVLRIGDKKMTGKILQINQ